ncbi:hypothetical protein HW41_04800 [Apilactobacillus kunkeei]|nr:hypothetical protein HW41_04800 [Apilactobacillus kunkeei]CAI2669189.1 hypothetical protein AKUG0401_UNKNOWN100020 [Apilactobacillus kunkeei]CAI2669257.1 hypothetical protein AKUG0101_UNKNOWN100020 [Apilactobacillus kunkeei]CAI2671012.1 hypothetical protein AKUG0405_UNKNOWN100020 [Apilactobacillus kunkeei]CAI2671079.1 hypothetical protein AKUG0801_UNKNOWN100020 [Apilactobacillus kunkeei]
MNKIKLLKNMGLILLDIGALILISYNVNYIYNNGINFNIISSTIFIIIMTIFLNLYNKSGK